MTAGKSASWLYEMRAEVQASLARHAQQWDAASDNVAEAKQRILELGVTADNRMASQQFTAERDLAKEADAKLQAGRFHELTRRELNVGIRRFQSHSFETYRGLVGARPDSLTSLVDAYFEQWTSLGRMGRRDELATLLEHAPQGVRVLHRGLPSLDLLGPKAPERIALRERRDLPSLLTYLSQVLRCRTYWEFYREALAAWIQDALGSQQLAWVWSELATSKHVSECLLPQLRNDSWFRGPAIAKAGVASIATQARVVAAVLGACRPSPEGALQSHILERLIRSSWGDPRVPPMSQGWSEVRAVDPVSFTWFLESLVKADLSLFFHYAMDEKGREHFWLRRLKQIRGTLVVLSNDKYEDVRRRIGSEEAGKAMLERARRAKSNGVSGFCLFFDRVVAVEFSETGNAAYLYPPEEFAKRILPRLNPVGAVTQTLKRRELPHELLRHTSGWEDKAVEILRRYGIY